MAKKIFKREFAGREIIVEVGEIAKQAGGSALIRYDETVILSTATASREAKDLDFFPLTVLFEEKLYAVGRIPGGFLRREGRPGEHATLSARLIDRPLRPLFPEGFRNEVQVVNSILSVNQDATPEMTAMFGSSLAVSISDIPFDGPVAGVYVGRVDNKYIINPSVEQMEKSDINLAVAGTKYAINMVEAEAKEVSEEAILKAIAFGHEAIKELIAFQEEIIKEVGKEKRTVELYTLSEDLQKEVSSLAKDRLLEAVKITESKLKRYNAIDDIKDSVMEDYSNRNYENDTEKKATLKQVRDILDDIVKVEVRRLITEDKIRPDGRTIEEVRPLDSQIDLLPRTHGSALFTRGETQVLSVVTLGAQGDEQKIDNVTEEESKRFMHHYNFPPFSVGETGRMGSPGRREIGHGALGERALLQVIPSEEEFPYTIRIVSEVLESNGSSSQASICASSLALMAAGVPIKSPVAGIAMGLITNGSLDSGAPYTILTDIQGMEDHLGDMDFKVAGTKNGITALQMDIKITGINESILAEALEQAKKGRETIMANMLATINEPRKEVGKYAPKVATMKIGIDKIRDVIGSGGKVINEIIEKSDGVKIDIEDDGRITIYHQDIAAIKKALGFIEKLTKEAKVGEIYEGTVVRIENFGAFVELFEGTDGLVHVSKMRKERVENPRDVVKVGQVVKVIVTEIDDKGRVNLSMKDLIKEESEDKGE